MSNFKFGVRYSDSEYKTRKSRNCDYTNHHIVLFRVYGKDLLDCDKTDQSHVNDIPSQQGPFYLLLCNCVVHYAATLNK